MKLYNPHFYYYYYFFASSFPISLSRACLATSMLQVLHSQALWLV